MDHIIQFLLIYLIIPMFGPWIASTVSNLITTFVSYMPSIVLLSGLGAISELPRLTLCLEVRASCFNHHCLAGNLTVLSGLNDVHKRYIRLIPSLYVLY